MAKILIVEDEEELRNAIRRTLELSGFDVEVAEDGNRALSSIQKDTPDLVLSDIFMPGMEGLEMIRKISVLHPNLPVVVMTGSLDRLFIDLGLKFGAVHGLNKPFSTDELILTIEKSLRAAQSVEENDDVLSAPDDPC